MSLITTPSVPVYLSSRVWTYKLRRSGKCGLKNEERYKIEICWKSRKLHWDVGWQVNLKRKIVE
jgi:hypothetical protein